MSKNKKRQYNPLIITLLFPFQLPEDLPFEYLLKSAENLYRKYPPRVIEKDVETMIAKE